jgi:ribosomal protein L11 methyltransferase
VIELFPEGFELVERPDGVELAVYVESADVRRLQATFPSARAVPVADGWEEAWKRYHRGAVVGSLWVGPPWEQPPAGLTPVVIDPGRAFGTGSHPTTRLCLTLLQRLAPASVVDLGCGSGVLAIAAAKLGHAPVWALDADPAAIEATSRNAAANGVEVAARLEDVTVDPLPRAAIALANISLEPLAALARRLPCRLLVASGYRDSDVSGLDGFRPVERLELGGWAADLYARK